MKQRLSNGFLKHYMLGLAWGFLSPILVFVLIALVYPYLYLSSGGKNPALGLETLFTGLYVVGALLTIDALISLISLVYKKSRIIGFGLLTGTLAFPVMCYIFVYFNTFLYILRNMHL